jgi:hypothetical protein
VLVALARASGRSSLPSSQSRLREDQVLGRLSRRFGLSRESLRERLLAVRSDARRGGRSRNAEQEDVAPEDHGADPGRLSAWDREVIEVLVGVPEAAGLIVREVPSGEIESREGRLVLEAARRLHGEGRAVELPGLLLEIADPAIQSLLVAVDETSAARVGVDAEQRLHHLRDALRRRSAERQAHESARTLKTSRLDPGSEAALLERLVAQRRAAQGMTDPKDG